MCGIVGYIGPRDAAGFLVGGLRRLEYRGYDSAGVATLCRSRGLVTVKTVGRIDQLDALLHETPAPGQIGIGHTRWATHGPPTKPNAHPHLGGNGAVAVVHNGVIENFQVLKERLQDEGRVFDSATDSEVIAELIASCLDGQPTLEDLAAAEFSPLVAAVQAALVQLQGTYGLAVLFRGYQSGYVCTLSGYHRFRPAEPL